jgi:hypothetical protein
MKKLITIFTLLAGEVTITAVIIITTLLSPKLQAQGEITGSIGFGSLGASIVGGDLATASGFTVYSPFISTETGVYSGVPLDIPVTFDGFQFNPAVDSVTPLASFSVGSINYSFEATSVTSYYYAPLNEWDIGGNGMAMVTGYSSTPGIWNLNLSQSGDTIVFDSSAAVSPVPEPSTLLLLGGGLVGLAGFARKGSCKCRASVGSHFLNSPLSSWLHADSKRGANCP